jgi:predicted MPP superfamily phosphohydrolase
MFGSFLILICSLIHAYVFWRISGLPFIKRHITLKHLLLAGLILWAILFSGLLFGHNRTGIFASTMELIAMTWMAVLFLFFISFIAADIITGFGFFFPKHKSSIRGYALIAGVLLSLAAFIQGYRAPTIEDYEVTLADLPGDLDGTVIVALSDLHAGSQLGDKWLAARVSQVNEQKPDIIVLLGDVVEGHSTDKNDAFGKTLSRLSAPLGVWAVLGNHENFNRGDNGNDSVFLKAGIPVLRGTWKELKPGLILTGIDSIHRRMNERDSVQDSMTPALAGRPEGATILLSHFPVGAEEAAGAGVDLMLCGHTHGGQIWPFSYIVKASYPLLAGQYDINGMPVIVSRGAGTWGPRMRLWKPGEIERITLRNKNPQERQQTIISKMHQIQDSTHD